MEWYMFGDIMFGEILRWIAIPFVLSTVYFRTRKVKMTIMTQTSMMEMEQHISKHIVIFGAAGDLCKEN